MKIPLRYQISEYDCGPTSMLNAISYLFEREDIPPEIVRNIMLFCLDCHGPDGIIGKRGTSCSAMMFLSNWLHNFGPIGQLDISSSYLAGQAVNFSADSRLRDALRTGGAAVVRLDLEGWHYVLLTGIDGDKVRMFDPYYYTTGVESMDIELVHDQPFAYNRLVPISYMDKEELTLYALGPKDTREAVLLFNEKTRLTPERTIEYMI